METPDGYFSLLDFYAKSLATSLTIFSRLLIFLVVAISNTATVLTADFEDRVTLIAFLFLLEYQTITLMNA